MADRLEGADRPFERLALLRVLGRRVERLLRDADALAGEQGERTTSYVDKDGAVGEPSGRRTVEGQLAEPAGRVHRRPRGHGDPVGVGRYGEHTDT